MLLNINAGVDIELINKTYKSIPFVKKGSIFKIINCLKSL